MSLSCEPVNRRVIYMGIQVEEKKLFPEEEGRTTLVGDEIVIEQQTCLVCKRRPAAGTRSLCITCQ